MPLGCGSAALGHPWRGIPLSGLSLHLVTSSVDIEAKLGHRLRLDAVASATLGVGKTGDGLTPSAGGAKAA